MKSQIKSILVSMAVLFVIFCFQSTSTAAPHNGEIFKLKQPDNSYVQVRVFGDEFYQRVESMDGYTLVRDPETNWICYAQLNDSKSDFVSTGIKYSEIGNGEQEVQIKNKLQKGQKLSKEEIYKKADEVKKILHPQSSYNQGDANMYPGEDLLEVNPAAGSTNVLGLTLLVKFPDKDTIIQKQEIYDMLNKVGYNGYSNNGSVRDYYYDVSGGTLVYNNHVTDFYIAKNPKSYYDDPNVKFGERATELILEALQNLEAKGFDFSTLTTNSYKTVLAVNVFYAGNADMGWGKGLWPHSGGLGNTFYADGVRISRYQITPLRTSISIATFIHENGHMLMGWPDLYDYDSDSKGVGRYSVMAYTTGGNPVPPDPYLRSIRSGWGEVKNLNNLPDKSTVTLNAGSLEAYKFEGPNPSEYFLIENIRKTGRWSNMPDEGLIIWHVDEKGSNNWQDMTFERHYLVSVEQADGRFDLERNINYGDSGDLFSASGNNAFSDNTNPNSKWWNGQPSGLNITNISSVGDSITFTINNSNIVTSATPTPTPTPTQSPTLTPTATPTITPTPTSTSTKILAVGDVNGDNAVNSIDFAYMRMYLLGMISDFPHENGMKAADVNADNSVNSVDFAYMRMFMLGYIESLPAEKDIY